MWEGRFKSTKYPPLLGWVPKVAGSLTVTKDAAVLAYTGIYRRGHTSTMKIDVQKGTGSQHGLGYFKGQCMRTQQAVTFTVLTKTDTEVTGTYASVAPLDEGTFTLRLKPRPKGGVDLASFGTVVVW